MVFSLYWRKGGIAQNSGFIQQSQHDGIVDGSSSAPSDARQAARLELDQSLTELMPHLLQLLARNVVTLEAA